MMYGWKQKTVSIACRFVMEQRCKSKAIPQKVTRPCELQFPMFLAQLCKSKAISQTKSPCPLHSDTKQSANYNFSVSCIVFFELLANKSFLLLFVNFAYSNCTDIDGRAEQP
jgi:hypothetical protein